MIKFLGERMGRPILGLGLSEANCKKLLEGKPIFIDLKVMMADIQQPPDLREATVLIFGGKDEYEMQGELKKYVGTLPLPLTHSEEN